MKEEDNAPVETLERQGRRQRVTAVDAAHAWKFLGVSLRVPFTGEHILPGQCGSGGGGPPCAQSGLGFDSRQGTGWVAVPSGGSG